jgi:flavin reductase ActVB
MDYGYEEPADTDAGAVALDGSTYFLHVRRMPGPGTPVAAARVAQAPVSESFRETMRALASGVVLVTTYVDDRPWGVTVTSCCSLSVEPPRILVSLMRNTASCQAIEANGVFGVDLLGDAHKHIAQFGAARGASKFLDPAALGPEESSLTPMVQGSLSHVDCELEELFDGGDHAIIVGRVVEIVTTHGRSSASPLLYFDGGFHHIGHPV